MNILRFKNFPYGWSTFHTHCLSGLMIQKNLYFVLSILKILVTRGNYAEVNPQNPEFCEREIHGEELQFVRKHFLNSCTLSRWLPKPTSLTIADLYTLCSHGFIDCSQLSGLLTLTETFNIASPKSFDIVKSISSK